MHEYTPRQRAGFVFGIVLSLLNIPGAFIPTGGSGDSETAGPPVAVLALGAALGLLAAGLLYMGYRNKSRGLVRAAVVVLVLIALTAAPAFFVDGVAAWVRLGAGLYVLATVATIVLLFSPADDRVTATHVDAAR